MEARFGYDFSGCGSTTTRAPRRRRRASTRPPSPWARTSPSLPAARPDDRRGPPAARARARARRAAGPRRSGAGAGVVQRLGAGEFLSRLFGEGTFDEDELRDYLEGRDSGEIEDDFDSDNKARAIVRAWRTGGSPWVLTARRKSVLIREMLSGAVFDDDEQMILELLVRSYNAELRYIFTTGGVSPNDVDGALHGQEQTRLELFLAAALRGRPRGRPRRRDQAAGRRRAARRRPFPRTSSSLPTFQAPSATGACPVSSASSARSRRR